MSDVHVILKAFGQTDTGLVRRTNEDALFVADLTTGERWTGSGPVSWTVGEAGVLIAVSDGMGGARAGEIASMVCLEAVLRRLRESAQEGQGGEGSRGEADRLKRAVVEASREVRAAAARPDRRGMGATLTAVFVRGGTAFIAEVGDSRAYLIRGEAICQVTHDQSYVQLLVDSGVITPEQAEQSPQKNIILQVMGQKDDVVAELGRIELRRGDRFLLCSDGLSNQVNEQKLLRFAAPPSPLDQACSALIEAAKAAGGDDNITVIVAEIGGDLPLPADDEACAASVQTVQEYKP